ncbi:MAG TPA: hypothetical protein VK790_06880 [Solirubrobacteraceae bacterium]|jgi:hypothetical protein|nr:hypothetical protein [Solirubrobacteraceae bacterium]
MSDESAQQPEGATDPSAAAPLRSLPTASEELARQDLPPVPVYGLLNDAHTQRLHEAAVQERETQAKQAEENRKLRKRIADQVSIAVAIQVGIADVAFLIYGFWNGWEVPGGTIVAWLSSTVVQVIAVGLVVTRSLFPSAGSQDSAPAGSSP